MADQSLLRELKNLDLQKGSSEMKHMSIEQHILNGVVTLFAWAISVQDVRAQASTVVRDELRGVTFHSIEISRDDLRTLQVGPGVFSEQDQMTLGLSALIFDENLMFIEYVLWVRHDGRRWLTSNGNRAVTITIDGERLEPEIIHTPHADSAITSLFAEQLELRLTANQIQQLINGRTVVLGIVTSTGVVEKTLTGDETERIRRFVVRVEPILLALMDRSVVSITEETRGRLSAP